MTVKHHEHVNWRICINSASGHSEASANTTNIHTVMEQPEL